MPFMNWWVIGVGSLLFGAIHLVAMSTVALLRKVGWIGEENAKALYASTPIKAAECALAYVLAAMLKGWLGL